MSRKLIFAALLVLLLAAAPVFAQENSDQILFLGFIPNIQFAPVYVGMEKGYFAEGGINLSVEYGDETTGVQLIGAGERTFGLISGEQVLLARAQSVPVVYVYQWYQQFPVGIVTPVDSGIETPADLAGRRVGIPGRFGASYSGLTAFLAANGLTEADIQLEEIGFNAAEVVCSGAVEASVVYISNEPLQIQQQCTDVRVFEVSPVAALVSNGMVTNEQTVSDNPALVEAIVSGFHRALADTINNPAQAYLLSTNTPAGGDQPHVPNLPLPDDFRVAMEAESAAQFEFLATNPDRAAVAESREALYTRLSEQFDQETLKQFRVLLNSVALWDGDVLGQTDPAAWQVTQDTLMSMGFLSSEVTLEDAYTNDFVVALSAE